MANTTLLPRNLPKILRDHGLKVVVVPGWRTRKTASWQNGFGPVGSTVHHTATPKGWTLKQVLDLLLKGRPGLSGPLTQLAVGRDATIYVIAAGRANHAGTAKSVGSVSSGDGNFLYVGDEAFNDGVGETYPTKQYEAMVLLHAVLHKEVLKTSVRALVGHKEISTTGKVDPLFNMDAFRTRVQRQMAKLEEGVVEMVDTRGNRIDHALADLRKAKGRGKRRESIQAAIAALTAIKPFKVKADR